MYHFNAPSFLTSAVAALVCLSGCSEGVYGTIKFREQPNQVDFRPELRERLTAAGDPSLVLVVPTAVASNAEVDSRDDSELFAVAERVLFKAGYPLRSEKLFDVVATGTTDYATLGTRVNTDYLIELVGVDYPVFSTNKYTDRRGRERTIFGNIEMVGARVTFRLSDVRTNAVVGFAAYNFVPCTEGCERLILPSGRVYLSSPQGSLAGARKPEAYELERAYSDETIVGLATEGLVRDLRRR